MQYCLPGQSRDNTHSLITITPSEPLPTWLKSAPEVKSFDDGISVQMELPESVASQLVRRDVTDMLMLASVEMSIAPESLAAVELLLRLSRAPMVSL